MIIGLSSQLVKVHYYFAFLNNIICAYNYHTSSPPLHPSQSTGIGLYFAD